MVLRRETTKNSGESLEMRTTLMGNPFAAARMAVPIEVMYCISLPSKAGRETADLIWIASTSSPCLMNNPFSTATCMWSNDILLVGYASLTFNGAAETAADEKETIAAMTRPTMREETCLICYGFLFSRWLDCSTN